jgi:hypothetical protein
MEVEFARMIEDVKTVTQAIILNPENIGCARKEKPAVGIFRLEGHPCKEISHLIE